FFLFLTFDLVKGRQEQEEGVVGFLVSEPIQKRSLLSVFLLQSPNFANMTTSKRLAEKKVAKFQKNITKRGAVPESSSKKGYEYPVGPILLGFFIFVVIGSSLFQIIRTATSGGMA
ncbi:Stress-associated endoplasmic reticulum protein, partial [Trema orientale]